MNILRKLNRWLDCLAFANAGNLGDFNRLLSRHDPAAPPPPTALPSGPAGRDFAGWLSHWNASASASGLRRRADWNA